MSALLVIDSPVNLRAHALRAIAAAPLASKPTAAPTLLITAATAIPAPSADFSSDFSDVDFATT